MDWDSFDFEKLNVKDITEEFDPNDPHTTKKLNEGLRKIASKLNKKSNDELKNLLTRLINEKNEIDSIPKERTNASLRIQVFLEFLSKFIKEVEKRIQ